MAGPLRWTIVLLASLLALVAWRMVSLGMADHYARNRPGEALQWRGDHPLALLKQAEQLAGTPGRQDEARRMAVQAASANPLDGRPYRVLGLLESAKHDDSRAAALYRKAWQLSPRDGDTNLWLEGYYLRTGKPVQALRHIDILLRMEPEMAYRQIELLRAMAAFAPAHDALAAALAKQPPWRAMFMQRICPPPESGTVVVSALMQRLRKLPGGLAAEERHLWIACLGAHGQWGEAYLTWVAGLSDDQQLQLTNVFNGSFEQPPSGAIFDWTLTPVAGARIAVEPQTGANGKMSLHLSFDDREVPLDNVRQALVLAPGPYRFQANAKAENLASVPGLVWRLHCIGSNTALGTSEPLRGTRGWRPLDFSFEVPAVGCAGQSLQLTIPARTRSETMVGGNGWFDDVRIVRSR